MKLHIKYIIHFSGKNKVPGLIGIVSFILTISQTKLVRSRYCISASLMTSYSKTYNLNLWLFVSMIITWF